MRLSSLSKTSLLLVACFAADKVLAILRQLIIARQFGLSGALDVFNIANNLPDMLFILISGGAMAMVVIPVLTEVIEKKSLSDGWRVFSSILNLTFIASFLLALGIWFFADTIVTSEVGIAPGFSAAAQRDVVRLMRLNLISTLIFSVSGLCMGALQANRRFLLPGIAPLFYNVGQIIGAVFLAPEGGGSFFGVAYPTFGLGIDGLAYGVIAGAAMHLMVQLPGLLHLEFRWEPLCDVRDENVRRMIRILIPRVLTVFFVQLIFIFRDNLASRLQTGAVTALSYGYMFQQLPETLIGTALGTALLPSLSLFIADAEHDRFAAAFSNACRLVVALTFGSAVIFGMGFGPVAAFALKMTSGETALLMWTLRGFLVGLTGHCLLEVVNRSFYAQQDALSPLITTILNFIVFMISGLTLYRPLGVSGISLSDSIAVTIQAALLILWLGLDPFKRSAKFGNSRLVRLFGEGAAALNKERVSVKLSGMKRTILRAAIGSAVAAAAVWGIGALNFEAFPGLNLNPGSLNLVKSLIGMGISVAVYLPFILPEIRMLKTF